MANYLYQGTSLLAAATTLVVTTAQAQEARSSNQYRRIVPIEQQAPIVIANPRADAVILRRELPGEVVKALPVKRQLTLANIKSKPVQPLGAINLNFKPMLDNPRAPFNVAAKLRVMPQVAEVIADETVAYEIDQGVVVRSALTYRLKPGACTDFLRLAALSTTGVQCASPVNDAAFSNPKDPHYVANGRERTNALADAKTKRETMRQDIAADVADLRASFSDRARYFELVGQLGDAEVSRLSALTDDQLTQELVNSAETTVEQVFFIPALETSGGLSVSKGLLAVNAATKLKLAPESTGSSAGAKGSTAPPASETTHNLQSRIFLTGFTLGRNYEWRQRIEKTIKWCLVGCKKTYYAEIYAGFSYGFGLRFPMQVSGLYKHKVENGVERASITPNFVPINGNAAQYAETGLPSSKLFDGKELVAEAQAYAGAGYKLPTLGSANVSFEVGKDFTSGLPAPYTNGQFQPPAPGESNLAPLVKVFDDFDLIGGRANFGVFGGQVFPAIKAELKSESLRFTLRDQLSGKSTVLTSTGQTVPLKINPIDKSSLFTIGDPVYNLGFLVTPGLNGRIFLDLAVWSNKWDWPVWFPQLAVQLPPGGVDFACHEDTTCIRSYNYSPTRATETVGPANPTESELQGWAVGFDQKWLPQCPDKKCEVAIKIVRQGTIYNTGKLGEEKVELLKQGKADEAQATNLKIFKGYLNANNEAAGVIEEAKKRVAKGGK